jgi:uncharacterized membrane protein
MQRTLAALCIVCLLGLFALGIAWELWLAPLRTGGSWLVLKVVPLLMPLGGLLQGKRYTYQWTSMLALLYIMEAAVRLFSGHGTEIILAGVEMVLALGLFGTAVACARRSKT